jgi:hypothetical protein
MGNGCDRRLIRDLYEHLTWSAGHAFLIDVYIFHMQWSFARVKLWLGESEDFRSLLALPRQTVKEALLDPGTFALLFSAVDPTAAQLDQLLLRCGLCIKTAAEDDSGSAVHISSDACQYTKTSSHKEAESASDFSFHRKWPKLEYRCTSETGYYPADFGHVEAHSCPELYVIGRRLAGALDLLAERNKTAFETVQSSIQLISVVKAPENPSLTSSVSRRRSIGKMGLVNAHSDKWNVPSVADAVLHEAIHSVIYKLELLHELYEDDDTAHRLTVVSPWSGRSLKLHSFVHACFVWFGLYNFWDLSGVDESLSSPVKRACRGFSSGSPLRTLALDALECIKPDVRQTINDMTEYVRSR